MKRWLAYGLVVFLLVGTILPCYALGDETFLYEAHGDEAEEDITRPGDVNGDGNINMIDAFAVYRHVSEGKAPAEISAAADVNGDGNINMIDAFIVYMPTGGLA